MNKPITQMYEDLPKVDLFTEITKNRISLLAD